MKLSESEQSEDPDGTRVEFIHTSDSNHKSNFGSSRNVNLTVGFGIPPGNNFLLLGFGIVGFILLNPLQEFFTFAFIGCSAFFPLFF